MKKVHAFIQAFEPLIYLNVDSWEYSCEPDRPGSYPCVCYSPNTKPLALSLKLSIKSFKNSSEFIFN